MVTVWRIASNNVRWWRKSYVCQEGRGGGVAAGLGSSENPEACLLFLLWNLSPVPFRNTWLCPLGWQQLRCREPSVSPKLMLVSIPKHNCVLSPARLSSVEVSRAWRFRASDAVGVLLG